MKPRPLLASSFLSPWALLLVVLAGCTEDNPEFEAPMQCAEGESAYLQSFALVDPEALDVLFVVANTPGSAALVASLREAAPAIIGALGEVDYRIGVLAAGGGGALNIPADARCPERGLVSPSSADPADALACLFTLGESTALPASIEAVSELPANTLRKQARLLIVVVGLVDDCSSGGALRGELLDCEWRSAELSSVTELELGLRRLKPDLDAIALALVAGPNDSLSYAPGTAPDTACSSVLGSALHAPRLHDLAERFEPLAESASVCATELGPTLANLMAPLAAHARSTYCLGKRAEAGVQSAELVLENEGRIPLEAGALGGFAFSPSDPRCPMGVVTVEPKELPSTSGLDAELEVVFCGR